MLICWSLTNKQRQKLGVAQKFMINITRRDKQRIEIIRDHTGIEDIPKKLEKLKWQLTGFMARMNKNRWAKRTTKQMPKGLEAKESEIMSVLRTGDKHPKNRNRETQDRIGLESLWRPSASSGLNNGL